MGGLGANGALQAGGHCFDSIAAHQDYRHDLAPLRQLEELSISSFTTVECNIFGIVFA
jgi:hypothetical protein